MPDTSPRHPRLPALLAGVLVLPACILLMPGCAPNSDLDDVRRDSHGVAMIEVGGGPGAP